MEVPTSSLELMQGVIDNRFGGDAELALEGLARIEREFDRPGMPMFNKVGNNCLVFHTNTAARKVCEENPETIAGAIVGDYFAGIDESSLVVGSYIDGFFSYNARVRQGSQLFYSNLAAANIYRSKVFRSYVALGTSFDSKMVDSYVHGSLHRMNLESCYVSVGAINDITATERILMYNSQEDRDDTERLTQHTLAKHGLLGFVVPQEIRV